MYLILVSVLVKNNRTFKWQSINNIFHVHVNVKATDDFKGANSYFSFVHKDV